MFDDTHILRAQERMDSARRPFESLYREIGSLLFPRQGNFNGQFAMQGQGRTDNIFDEYAEQALADGVSVFLSYVIPRGQRWQKLSVADERLMANVGNRQWLELVEKRLFALRNDPKSGFTNCTAESATSLLAYGLQSTWVDVRRDAGGRVLGLSYQSEHIGQIYIETDAEGDPMRIHRKFSLTAQAALRKWGDKTPPKVRDAAKDDSTGHTMFEFLHVIEPNTNIQPDRIDAAGKPWASCYYSMSDRARFEEGGYRSLPRTVSRYARAPNEDYGRSPAMTILPAVRATQIIMQDRVLAAEQAVKPSLLAMDDALDNAIVDLGPYGITYGGLDEQGNATIKPLFEGIDPRQMEALHAQMYQVIDKAFFRDLLQLRREQKTHMSAARTMEEIAEKGVLLDPLARQETEWFSRMLDREIDLMAELRMLDDVPPQLEEYFADGNGLDIRYDNQLALMQAAGESIGYLRTAEQVAPLAQFSPEVVEQFLREYPMAKVLPNLGRINGIPATWQSTDEEKKKVDEDKAIAAQTQQLLAAAPALASAGQAIAQGGGGVA